ncbi:MAG TPA: type II CAAX endopeptidase family protein [Candidatus Saccharimonadia bacterium]|jgi:hypothetical protein|nr:type II CAAX endopeptidase family protein [Candidatus Saccharimonadia bacterium]
MTKKSSSTNDISRGVVTWFFLLFGFALAAIAYLTIAGIHPDTDFSPVIILMAYSPSIAAFVAAWLVPGTGGPFALLKRALVWRVNPAWYLAVLFGPLALVVVAIVIYGLTGGSVPAQCLIIPTGGDLGSMVGPLFAGMVGEEFGWRGFAQALLQKRLSVLVAGVIVGVLWATWHQWTGFAPGGHLTTADVATNYIRLIATAVIYGWIYARTGSLLVVMLAHAGHNIAVDLLPSTLLATSAMPLIIAMLYVAAAAVLVMARPGQFLRSVSAIR